MVCVKSNTSVKTFLFIRKTAFKNEITTTEETKSKLTYIKKMHALTQLVLSSPSFKCFEINLHSSIPYRFVETTF